MIRPTPVEEKICPRCQRPGWLVKKRYELQTIQEWIAMWDGENKQYALERIPELFARPKGAPSDAMVVIPHAGATIGFCLREAQEISAEIGRKVTFEFNGVAVVVDKDSELEVVYQHWEYDLHNSAE